MDMIDLDFNDAQEFDVLPDGEKVEVQIVKCEAKAGSSDPERTVLHVRMAIQKGGMYNDIYDYASFPKAGEKSDDLKKYTRMVNRIKSLLECFDVPLENVSPAEMAQRLEGQIGYIIVKQEDDQEGNKQNRVKQYLTRS